MTTYTIYAGAADDGVISVSVSNYAAARAGTGDLIFLASDEDPNSFPVHQGSGLGALAAAEGFVGFDTSGVTGTISSAILSLFALSGYGNAAESDFTVEARLRDWGTTVETSDFVPGTSLSALTLLASLAIDDAAIPDGVYAAFSSSGLAANINQSGTTRMVLNVDSHRTGTDPSSSGWLIYFASADAAGTTQDPKLVIDASSGLTINAGGGSYTLTGTAAAPKRGRKTVAAAGSYAITGTAATPKLGRETVAGAGSYAITGTAAATRVARRVVAAAGSYIMSGATAALRRDLRLSAATGAYALTGTAASLVYVPIGGYTITVDAGSYALSGTAAAPELGRRVAAASGAYSITGTAATVKKTWKASASSGSYLIDGSPVALTIATPPEPEEVRQPGGWLPLKYISKDGSVSETLDAPEIAEAVTLEDLPPNVPLSQALIDALRLTIPPDMTPALLAEMQAAQGELLAIQDRMRLEDDVAVALLLLS